MVVGGAAGDFLDGQAGSWCESGSQLRSVVVRSGRRGRGARAGGARMTHDEWQRMLIAGHGAGGGGYTGIAANQDVLV